jgi:probable phosphoglycerate mutase
MMKAGSTLELVSRLKGLPVAAVFSSPLERAVETARPVAESMNLSCIILDDFLEVDYGSWTDLPVAELTNDPVFRYFNSFRSCTRIPGGELMSEVQMRMIGGIEKLRSMYTDRTVVIVSHADPIKSALAWYAGINLDFLDRIEISPASLSIIELYDEIVRIILVNETGRLRFT